MKLTFKGDGKLDPKHLPKGPGEHVVFLVTGSPLDGHWVVSVDQRGFLTAILAANGGRPQIFTRSYSTSHIELSHDEPPF